MELFSENRDNEDFMILAMTLAAAADGIDDIEEEAIFNLMKQIPRLSKLDYSASLTAAMDFIVKTGYEKSIDYFANVKDNEVKNAILVLALEISMANEDVSEDEEDILVHFSNVMNVSDEDLHKIIDVISWKFI